MQTVDDYIAAQPEGSRPLLGAVRGAIRRGAPEAAESISYKIAAYHLGGKPLLYFAGWKKHWSLYPVTEGLAAAFAQELARYEVEKGTVRFPLTEPAPVGLVERIARFRVGEVTGG